MRSRGNRRERGFTLIEILIVVVVIAILASLLSPALISAVRRSREAATSASLGTIDQAFASYKLDVGAYPPSRVILIEDGDYSDASLRAKLGLAGVIPPEIKKLRDRTLRHLRRAYPRAAFSTTGPTFMPGPDGSKMYWHDFNGNDQIDRTAVILDGFECLVFFLQGMPSNSVEAKPIPTTRNPIWPFAAINGTNHVLAGSTRVAPRYTFSQFSDYNGNGFTEAIDALGDNPIAFFASYGGEYDPLDCELASEPIRAFMSKDIAFAARGPNPYSDGPAIAGARSIRWHRADSYQLISAGRDRMFGPGGSATKRDNEWFLEVEGDHASVLATVAPGVSPQLERDVEYDNVTNFSSAAFR